MHVARRLKKETPQIAGCFFSCADGDLFLCVTQTQIRSTNVSLAS